MRLRHILFLIFGAMTALPLAFFWFWLENSMIDKEIADVSERHLLIARNLGAALERYQRDVKSGFELISENMTSEGAITKVEAILKDLNFSHICLVDLKTGKILRRTGFTSAFASVWYDKDTLDRLAKIAKGDQTTFSPVTKGSDGNPAIYVVKRSGDRLAIGELNTNYIVALGKSISFGVKGHAAIVDHEGNVLAHPLPSWIKARKNISKVSAVQRMLKGEQGVETFYSPALKGDMIAGFTAVNGPGWGVMIPQPVVELEQRAQIARDSLFYIVAAFIGAAALFAAAFTPLLTSPLRRVVGATRKLTEGRLSTRLNIRKSFFVPRELRELQENFNAMATAVETYHIQESQKRENAEQRARQRSEYMSNLTHELRTPLNAVIGFSEIMCKEKFGPLGVDRYQEFVSDINTSASQLLRLVNELLEFSRIDAGALVLNEEHLSIANSLNEVARRVKGKADEKSVKFEVALPPAGFTVFADPAALAKMLESVTENAVRNAPIGGAVTITATIPAEQGPEIAVSDNGNGLTPAELAKATQPFVNMGGDGSQGGGMGLAITSKLAELHDAELVLASEPGKGTVARLVFPRERLGVKTSVAA